MIQLHRVQLTREQLDRIPDAERRLFILIAHAGNELNALAKLFHFAASSSGKADDLVAQAETMQALVLARTLTGKIYEFWVPMQSTFFAVPKGASGTALSKVYEPLLEDEPRVALEALKRYFGRKNLIDTVRNKFAFHYSPDQLDAGYKAVIEGDSLQVFLAQHTANTLYAFAETITSRAMMEAIKPGDHKGAFEAVIDETSDAVNKINDVISGLMIVCFQRYLGENLYALGADIVEVEGLPDSQDVAIPYFVEIAGANTE